MQIKNGKVTVKVKGKEFSTGALSKPPKGFDKKFGDYIRKSARR